MERWTQEELERIDDISFAYNILAERNSRLSRYSPLSMKLEKAMSTLEQISEARTRFIWDLSAIDVHGKLDEIKGAMKKGPVEMIEGQETLETVFSDGYVEEKWEEEENGESDNCIVDNTDNPDVCNHEQD